jgi:hypothetical protein
MFFWYRATPAFRYPLTGFATGVRSGAGVAAPLAAAAFGALAAGAACCAIPAPALINIVTATKKLACTLIIGSLSGLSA